MSNIAPRNTYLGVVDSQEELDVIKHLNITEWGVEISKDYGVKLETIEEYTPYFNQFCQECLINHEDRAVKDRRETILRRSAKLFNTVADFTLLDNNPISLAAKRCKNMLRSLGY